MIMQTYMKHNKTLLYRVEVKRIKHTYFKIKQGYVLVTTNKKMLPYIPMYLNQQFEKLYIKMQQQPQKDDTKIQLQGHLFEFIFHEGPFHYEINQQSIIAYGNDVESTKKNIYLLEIKKRMEYIHPNVLSIIKPYGVFQVPFKYKYLKSKFGSYHKKHQEITLNTILATLPDVYLTYVLFHEYAHQIEFNHSKRFYNLLDQWMPGHKTIQKRLKNVAII